MHSIIGVGVDEARAAELDIGEARGDGGDGRFLKKAPQKLLNNYSGFMQCRESVADLVAVVVRFRDIWVE